MASAHDKYDDAQHLCDRLRDELSTGISHLTRNEGRHWCSYGRIRSSKFAYIGHNRHKLRVYLRCLVDDKSNLEERLPLLSTVLLNTRTTITPKQWSALTPYFADLHSEREISEIAPLLAHLSAVSGGAAPRGPNAELSGSWQASPDIAHNAAVEAAAIECVQKNLGPSRDRQKDNCGWDLEFLANGRTLCVEVKGLAGAEIGVELTPNEYTAMKRAMDGAFTEGDYRLAIVCEALSKVPSFFLFRHEKDMCWRCERSQRQITVSQRIAARLS